MSAELPTTATVLPFLTVAEVAHAMRVSKMSVYWLVDDGSLPALRIAKSVRVPAEALEEYLGRRPDDKSISSLIHPGRWALRASGGEY